MLDLTKIIHDKHGQVAEFKNPFDPEKVESISLRYSKKLFTDDFEWWASVSFKNGATSGTQSFAEKELPTILSKIETFLKNL